MVEYQAGPWEPVSVYDSPMILAEGLFSNERALGAAWDAATSPGDVSLSERDTAVTRLKQKYGGDGVRNALIDIATNPWVWISFLSTPVLGSSASGLARLMDGKRGFNAYANQPGLFRSLMTMGQNLDGTAAAPAAKEWLRHVSDLAEETRGEISPLLMRWLTEEVGLDKVLAMKVGLDWTKLEARGLHKEAARLKKANFAMFVSLGGMDKTVRTKGVAIMPRWLTMDDAASINLNLPGMEKQAEELYGAFRKGDEVVDLVMPDGELRRVRMDKTSEMHHVALGEKAREAWVRGGTAESLLRSEGLWDLREAFSHQMRMRLARNLFKEDVVQHMARTRAVPAMEVADMIDVNKAKRVFRSLKGVDTNRTLLLPYEADSIMQSLMSAKMRQSLYRGTMTEDTWNTLIREGVASNIVMDAYMPRNYMTQVVWNREGTELREIPRAWGSDRQREEMKNLLPRQREELYWHPDDLEYLAKEFGATDRLMHLWSRSKSWAQSQIKPGQETRRAFMLSRINTDTQLGRYFEATGKAFASTQSPSTTLLKEQARLYAVARERGWVAPENAVYEPNAALGEKAKKYHVDTPMQDIPPEQQSAGGFTLWDMFRATVHGIPEEYAARDLIEKVMIPSMAGDLRYPVKFMENSTKTAQAFMRKFEETVGDYLDGLGDFGKKMRQGLKYLGNADWEEAARVGGNNLTGYLYSTHLGMNLSSVMANMTQPFQLGVTWLGPRATAYGYGQAIRDLGRYASKRRKMGLRISRAEREALLDETIPFWREAGIGEGALGEADAMLARGHDELPGWGKYWSMDFPLKLFEKAEWMNRLVTAHAVNHRLGSRVKFDKAGRIMGRGTESVDTALMDIERGIEETQFGAGIFNTPLIFMPEAGGPSVTRLDLIKHPLFRQFQQFMTRSLVTPFVMASRIGEARHLGLAKIGMPQVGVNITNPFAVTMLDLGSMMGYGSMIYYLGRDLLSADLSKYGMFNVTFEGTGFEQNLLEDPMAAWQPRIANIYQAPVIQASFDLIRGVAAPGESEFLQRSIARLLPAGIPIARTMQAIPKDFREGPFGALPSVLSKKYADYSNPLPDGRVPFYSGDGRLIQYIDPKALIFKSLGIDPTGHQKAGDMDNWLVSQRDQILAARREYLNHLVTGDVVASKRTAAQFQARFGVPLTVSKEQLDAFVRSREVPRTERLLDRMPREVRQQMASVIDTNVLEYTRQQLLAAETATQREKAFGRTNQNQWLLRPEVQQELQQQNAEPPTIPDRGYVPFAGF